MFLGLYEREYGIVARIFQLRGSEQKFGSVFERAEDEKITRVSVEFLSVLVSVLIGDESKGNFLLPKWSGFGSVLFRSRMCRVSFRLVCRGKNWPG